MTHWHWYYWLLLGILVLVAEALLCRWFLRLGIAVGLDLTRRKVERQAVPDLFKSADERHAAIARGQYGKRAGRLPWNFRRKGLTEADKALLDYELETGRLDKAIDQIVAEETEPRR